MTTLGKYELQEQIGQGGFGTVYRAIDITLDREVAIKVLLSQMTTDLYFLEKFREEAKMVAALNSPNIVTIHGFDEIDGYVFITMQYLSGGSLKQKLDEQGAISYKEAFRIMQQICSGLQVAHKKGLVHRDIKPANILFDQEDNAVVSDFGLAKAVRQFSLSPADSAGGLGTPAYSAPELWEGKPPASTATDIYSLGCVLSEMLTGEKLFDGDSTKIIITQHLVADPKLPEHFPQDTSSETWEVIKKALAKDPLERYQTAEEFMNALHEPEESGISQVMEKSQPTSESKEKEREEHTVSEVESNSSKNESSKYSKNPDEGNQDIKITSENGDEKSGGEKPKALMWKNILRGFIISLLIITIAIFVWAKLAPLVDGGNDLGEGAGTIMISPRDNMPMVYIPSGEFLMGSDDGEDDNEGPEHTVFLGAYWIDQTEVTNAMYEECVEAGACEKPAYIISNSGKLYFGFSQFDNFPVIFVNWDQANDYCTWVGRQLPTEAQWEKAARGVDGRPYPWGGAEPEESLANFKNNMGYTTEVGSYPNGASPYGVLDMAGNVSEWVADWYDGGYYSSQDKWSNPTGPNTGIYRVIRGGSWNYKSIYIRTTNRGWSTVPSSSRSILGFRCTYIETAQ